MGALFYSPDGSKGIFKGGFQSNTLIDLPDLHSLFGSEGAKSFTVITDASIENNETIQFFLTFDDIVKYFYFGKGLGSMTITGLIFTECEQKPGDSGQSKGMSNFLTTIGNLRGKELRISLPPIGMRGVITNHRLNILTEPTMMAEFSISLAITWHNMPKPQIRGMC